MHLISTRHLTKATISRDFGMNRSDRGVEIMSPLAPWLVQDVLEHLKVDQVLRKAVIPAAGLGRRMSSLTGGTPKEMLLLAGRPIIHHVVQEAIDAGIVEICIVIRKSKQEIRRYFESDNPEACEAERPVEKLRSRCKIVFAYQAEPKGRRRRRSLRKRDCGRRALRIADSRSAVHRASWSNSSVGQQKTACRMPPSAA